MRFLPRLCGGGRICFSATPAAQNAQVKPAQRPLGPLRQEKKVATTIEKKTIPETEIIKMPTFWQAIVYFSRD